MKQMDCYQASLLIDWSEKNLLNCIDPRIRGKANTANHKRKWRYRIDDYRILAVTEDDEIVIPSSLSDIVKTHLYKEKPFPKQEQGFFALTPTGKENLFNFGALLPLRDRLFTLKFRFLFDSLLQDDY